MLRSRSNEAPGGVALLICCGSICSSLALSSLALPSTAFAHGGDSGGTQLPTEVHTVTPQGAQAKETLSRIEKDTASAAFVKEALFHGKRALQRADGANAAGDADGAALLSRVALAHATNAEASLRAIAAEKKANEAQTKAKDLQDKLIRTRTLLADTQAQRGQVTAELVRADEDAKKASERSRSKEEERLKKGQTGDPKKSDAKKSDAKKSGAPKTDAKAGGSR